MRPSQTRTKGAAAFGLLLVLAACSTPSPSPVAPVSEAPRLIAAPSYTPTMEATSTASPAADVPTLVPTPTATPLPPGSLDIVLLDGTADVAVDGQSAAAGPVSVAAGWHHVAALENGATVAETDVQVAPSATERVELVVPPPLSPLGVIVENSPEARPQSGLATADVVYETLAEGGIPRFMAVYITGDAPVVGPVRSLRHYFAFAAAEYGADLVHIGSSPQGFAWRDAMHLGKLDESAGDPGVWRVRTRAAPHNAYTATQADRAALGAAGRQRGGSWGPLRLDATLLPSGPTADQINLTFNPAPYGVSYAWDGSVERYRRFMDGAPHRDAATGEQLTTSSVVVQCAEISLIPGDDKGRVDIDLAGAHGELMMFSQGKVRHGTWSKDGPTAPTAWLDEEQRPLSLPPGPVWVEIVPLTASVSFH